MQPQAVYLLDTSILVHLGRASSLRSWHRGQSYTLTLSAAFGRRYVKV